MNSQGGAPRRAQRATRADRRFGPQELAALPREERRKLAQVLITDATAGVIAFQATGAHDKASEGAERAAGQRSGRHAALQVYRADQVVGRRTASNSTARRRQIARGHTRWHSRDMPWTTNTLTGSWRSLVSGLTAGSGPRAGPEEDPRRAAADAR